MKTKFFFIITIIILLSVSYCTRESSFNFEETFEDFGLSMRHPKFEKLESYGFDQKSSPATSVSGVLMGGTQEHTITTFWFSNPFSGEMTPEEEYNTMKLRLDFEVGHWERAEEDFKSKPRKYFTSPMNHRVFYQTWSYKNGPDRVYGVIAVWYCKESKRIFQMTILNKSDNNENLIMEYVDGFECH